VSFRDRCVECNKPLKKVIQIVDGHLVENKKYVQCKKCNILYPKKDMWHVKGSYKEELGLSLKQGKKEGGLK